MTNCMRCIRRTTSKDVPDPKAWLCPGCATALRSRGVGLVVYHANVVAAREASEKTGAAARACMLSLNGAMWGLAQPHVERFIRQVSQRLTLDSDLLGMIKSVATLDYAGAGVHSTVSGCAGRLGDVYLEPREVKQGVPAGIDVDVSLRGHADSVISAVAFVEDARLLVSAVAALRTAIDTAQKDYHLGLTMRCAAADAREATERHARSTQALRDALNGATGGAK